MVSWLSKCNHLKTKPVLLSWLISFLLLNIYHYAFHFLVYLFSSSVVWRSPRADNALYPPQNCILEPSPWFGPHICWMIDRMNLLIQCIWTAEDIVNLLSQKVFGGKGGRNLLFKLIPGVGNVAPRTNFTHCDEQWDGMEGRSFSWVLRAGLQPESLCSGGNGHISPQI